MTKLQKVQKALIKKTTGTDNTLTVTTELDNRFQGKKYATRNIITNNLQDGFKTLSEIIKEYELNI